jgi:hypothetical protein
VNPGGQEIDLGICVVLGIGWRIRTALDGLPPPRRESVLDHPPHHDILEGKILKK